MEEVGGSIPPCPRFVFCGFVGLWCFGGWCFCVMLCGRGAVGLGVMVFDVWAPSGRFVPCWVRSVYVCVWLFALLCVSLFVLVGSSESDQRRRSEGHTGRASPERGVMQPACARCTAHFLFVEEYYNAHSAFRTSSTSSCAWAGGAASFARLRQPMDEQQLGEEAPFGGPGHRA